MNLVVFDIDDTLTRTMEVDTECFIQTVQDVLRFDATQLTWEDFPHVTDTAVLDVLYRRVRDQPPRGQDGEDFLERFSHALAQAHRTSPERFSEVPGAAALLHHLQAHPDWTVAMATGAWRRTAEFKLSAAGIEYGGIPLATSDDHHTRAEIVRTAMERAAGRIPPGRRFRRVVAVGDGSWDVQTAKALDLAFIGVGPPERLEAIGAKVGVADYTDVESFWALLENAPPA